MWKNQHDKQTLMQGHLSYNSTFCYEISLVEDHKQNVIQ